jgi:hypothetical protein
MAQRFSSPILLSKIWNAFTAGRDEDASLVWEGKTTDGHPVTVSVRLGNPAIFLEKETNGNKCEQEVLQVNLGRVA